MLLYNLTCFFFFFFFFSSFFFYFSFQPSPLYRSENLYHFELMLKVGKIQEESGLERGGGVFFFFIYFFMDIVL